MAMLLGLESTVVMRCCTSEIQKIFAHKIYINQIILLLFS